MKKFFRYLFKATIAFFILSSSAVIIFRFVPIPFTPFMLYKSAASVFQKEFRGINKKWVPLESISKNMQRAVIKAEDYNFYNHYGFDFDAIEKAIEYNKTHKKKIGASTISQQTAKNVFLWPSRSWIRKGLEAYFTVLIEIFWTKERILESYLNVIELGPGLYGVEAAAQKYFKISAKKLNRNQATLMAAVLPNPIKFRIDKPSAYVLRRQRKIMGTKIAPVQKTNIEPERTTISEFIEIKFDQDDESETEKKREMINNESNTEEIKQIEGQDREVIQDESPLSN